MLLLNKPSEDAIRRFINWQQSLSVSYAEVGTTKDGICPSGYGTDQVREELGSPGSVIAVLAWHSCFWSLNACRIVYIINEQGPVTKFGFGYGTLPDHAETGEERFLLEWGKSTEVVSYDILVFSNPNSLLGWLAYPLVRFIQNRFRRDSARLMKRKLN